LTVDLLPFEAIHSMNFTIHPTARISLSQLEKLLTKYLIGFVAISAKPNGCCSGSSVSNIRCTYWNVNPTIVCLRQPKETMPPNL